MHKYNLLIQEFHLDTFGHVNNATYLALYEEARWDLITSNGYGLKRVQELQKGPIILSVQCSFRKEIKNREEITIETTFGDYSKLRFSIYQKMVRPSGEVCSEAEFLCGFFDMKERKLIPPTEEWFKGIGLSS